MHGLRTWNLIDVPHLMWGTQAMQRSGEEIIGSVRGKNGKCVLHAKFHDDFGMSQPH